jgi:hypothetical protein
MSDSAAASVRGAAVILTHGGTGGGKAVPRGAGSAP